MLRSQWFATCLVTAAVSAGLAPAAAQESGIRVGVYAGPGTDAADRATLGAALKGGPGLTVTEVSGVEGLSGVDVLVVGGGSGSKLARGLGASGGRAVAAWVRKGGGYVGLGAGAYLAARGYNAATRVVELVDARVVAPKKWKRGTGKVRLKALVGTLPGTWAFQNGPMFAPARGHQRRGYEAVARFEADPASPVKVVVGAHGIVRSSYGAGRVVLFSVLAHQSAETTPALIDAVRWAHTEGKAGTAAPIAPTGAVRVAVLDDLGCIDGCVARTFYALDVAGRRHFVRRVSGREVAAGALSFYDVVILPGGSATKQSKALTPKGRERLKEFVAKGGGYVGICAGAYLAAAEPARYGLGLVAAKCVDTKHWKRGEGVVELASTPDLVKITGARGATLKMLYANGPLLEPLAVEGLPEATVLARFTSDMAKHGAPKGVMPGKVAALSADYRKGRVVVFSTHPELTKGLDGMVRKAVAWVSRSPAQ